MNDQAFSSPKASAAAICSPRSPASARANGSRNTASSRSVSRARYTAIQRAVSETSRMIGSSIAGPWSLVLGPGPRLRLQELQQRAVEHVGTLVVQHVAGAFFEDDLGATRNACGDPFRSA